MTAETWQTRAAVIRLRPSWNMRDEYLEGMSKVMIDAVNSEEYAQATGTLLTNYLTFTAPFRETLDKTMLMALEQLSTSLQTASHQPGGAIHQP